MLNDRRAVHKATIYRQIRREEGLYLNPIFVTL